MAKMRQAQNLSFPGGLPGSNRIKDPLNKTIHMAIRKEKKRRAAHAAAAPFNGIRGLEKLT